MENRERIVILGAGESGTGAAILARQKGFDVFVSEAGKIKPYYRDLLDEYNVLYESGGHSERLILNATEVIKSPGIPESAPIVKILRKKDIRIISEIEFAGRYTNAKMICITGSNGKTTTTSLIHHMMRKAGLNVGIAGNVGRSFALQVATDAYDYYVLELSSFQLDGMYEFKADIAILLNITPDHLDRYDYDLQNYVDSKFRVGQNLTEEEYFVFCSDDEITIKELEKIVSRAQQLPFAYQKKEKDVAWVEEDELMRIEFDDVDFSMSVEELSLKGRHNTYNSMAAGIAGNVLKIRNEVIREALMDFQGVEHRLATVMKVHAINFINDSKATNVNSTWYALESVNGNTVWIVGGVDKGNDYSELNNLVENKVKAIVCLGKDNQRVIQAFSGKVESIVESTSMEEAVKTAYYLASDGETVLLSPACASFDLFESFEDRGRQFKSAVRGL
ncbi:MAG: UDP-N-acetylmuramoyl-L-alanine--D-glutamate ligase [Bacteroidales bacterium]|nr:UDP-N-acetylmuramoyl-L-alanine--D-glutamate ligase [Bacteroidales bacterium]